MAQEKKGNIETNNSENTTRTAVNQSFRKLKNASRKENSNGISDITSLDKALAKQEQASLEANRIAAADPELRGKT